MILLGVLSIFFLISSPAIATADWQELEPGIELRVIAAQTETVLGSAEIIVVRVDPNLWKIELTGRSRTGTHSSRTARGWAESGHYVIATNAGMFATDHSTHIGYMESDGHVNNGSVSGYQSVAAFNPRDPEVDPPFRIFDMDDLSGSIEKIRKRYETLIQNLRLIKRPGRNRWSQQPKMWSEAALGEDASGRILFLFCRSPLSMHDFNLELLRADIDLVAAQHLEGGPEAQLYINVGGVERELVGSFETGFMENDENEAAWPIPNVLGVVRRTDGGSAVTDH